MSDRLTVVFLIKLIIFIRKALGRKRQSLCRHIVAQLFKFGKHRLTEKSRAEHIEVI